MHYVSVYDVIPDAVMRTGERGSTVSASRSAGVRLILWQLSNREGGLAWVTEARGVVPFALS